MITVDFDLIGVKPGEFILDAGCGGGRHTWELCKKNYCSVYALDIDDNSLRKSRDMLRLMEEVKEVNDSWLVLKGDVTNLPFKDAAFDKIICSEVLEHIPDDQKGVAELVRVLKADGTIAVSVPTYITEAICWRISKDYYGFPGGHIRKYKAHKLIELLTQNNLTVYATRRKHALHSFYWILRCLFGIRNENALIPRIYYRFLVWDLTNKNRFTRLLEGLLNPFIAKSMVIYARKSASP
jgi:ubiquinone/menaquinone biosynthesis C-methylase UbiE